MPTLAPIAEIFSSLQGEGLLVGERQLFLRFAGCNLRCAYCDTPTAREIPAHARIEQSPGQRDWQEAPSAMAPAQVISHLRRLARAQPGLHHSLSLTGGEPLLHTGFLAELLPLLRDLGLPAYLETNGTLADELPRVLAQLDYVCADVKLPSATRQAALWGAHERFLVTLAAHADPARRDFVKCVFSADTTEEELSRAVRLVASVNPDLPLVLQPVSPVPGGPPPPGPEQTLRLHALARRHLSHVRVIPQVHRLAGWL